MSMWMGWYGRRERVWKGEGVCGVGANFLAVSEISRVNCGSCQPFLPKSASISCCAFWESL